MNIYFTSNGLDIRYSDFMNSYNDIIELLKGKKVAIIPNAKLIKQDRTNSVIAKKELEKNGIVANIIDIDNEKLIIESYDALYLSGGEPKYLMDSIISAGLFDKIKDFIDNGGIIIGQSAGAMIFSKTYLDTRTSELFVANNGFDYSDKIIVPHYDKLSRDILEKIPRDVIKINDNDRLIKINSKLD